MSTLDGRLKDCGVLLTAIMKKEAGKRLSKAEKQILCDHTTKAVVRAFPGGGRVWTRCTDCAKSFIESRVTVKEEAK